MGLVHCCKRDEVYFTTLLRQNNGWQNGLKSRMLFSELYTIMANKITFVGFKGAIATLGSAPAFKATEPKAPKAEWIFFLLACLHTTLWPGMWKRLFRQPLPLPRLSLPLPPLPLPLTETEKTTVDLSSTKFAMNPNYALDNAFSPNYSSSQITYVRDSQTGVHAPLGVRLPIGRGTFKVNNWREKYVYILFVFNYLCIYQWTQRVSK